MSRCFFVSDLHGLSSRYGKLIDRIRMEIPTAVFVGGDILPSGMYRRFEKNPFRGDFIRDFLMAIFTDLRQKMGKDYPRIFVILGNDDPRAHEFGMHEGEKRGLWEYLPCGQAVLGDFEIYGYSYVNPTPFLLKDWEKYDVANALLSGAIAPEAGRFTVERSRTELQTTIENDLEVLAQGRNFSRAIFLFHAPPFGAHLDRAFGAESGQSNSSVGSLAIRRFIEKYQPLLTLHGHIHESTFLSGFWRDQLGSTTMFSAAHTGEELALIRVELENISIAERELI